MGLDAVRRADDQDRRVQHVQGAFGFAGKIGMPGGVHQGQVRPVPGEAGFLGKNGDAPVLLHPVRIEKGVAMVHPALAPDGAGKKEHGFGKGGFSRVHMGAQADDRTGSHGDSSLPDPDGFHLSMSIVP